MHTTQERSKQNTRHPTTGQSGQAQDRETNRKLTTPSPSRWEPLNSPLTVEDSLSRRAAWRRLDAKYAN